MSIRALILNKLEKGKLISGQRIAEELNVTRANLHKHISKLRLSGFIIESKKNKGYFLRAVPKEDTYENIVLKYPEELGNIEILHRSKIDSTQSFLKESACRGAKEWSVAVADEQTAGYGRIKRKWSSGRGGLWFSVLLRPTISVSSLGGLSLVVSVALRRALLKTIKTNILLKWPNDVLVIYKGKAKKIAGIITEVSTDGSGIDWVVIGVGVNTNNIIKADLSDTAVSLRAIKKNVDNVVLFKNIIFEFKNCYKVFMSSGFGAFTEEYNAHHYLNGKYVEISQHNNMYSGKASVVNREGALLIEKDGKRVEIIAGDASVKNNY